MVERCCGPVAISAAMLPGLKDGLSELALSAATWHKDRAIDETVHLLSQDGR